MCGLGNPLKELQAVSDGSLHRVWRLDTTQGTFAVKQLNSAIVQTPHIRDIYRLSERIAEAMAVCGVPAVAALSCNEGPVQEIEGRTGMIYRWIEGETLSLDAVEPERARQIGALLGRIHTLNLQFPALSEPEWGQFRDDDWNLLTVHAYDRGIPWATPVRSVMHRLIEWSKMYEHAGEKLSRTYVLSHRDLGQKNVLWQDEHTPWVIDWEAAGLINPTMELASVALDWSGLASGVVREDTFAAIMESYVDAGGVVRDAGIDALYGVLGIWLGWLLFNMRRSLGEATLDEEERQLSIQETPLALARLRTLTHYAEQWASWIDRWRR
ncbi:MAG: phosphotransferase [Ktedonobacteraceae bacterium]|nr:phosphotransferase [Ktedonobacteraceae bacterium]